jgi:hypothetical protein
MLEGQTDLCTDQHAPSAEGNFSNKSGNTMKSLVIEHYYNTHMGYVDKRVQMSTMLTEISSYPSDLLFSFVLWILPHKHIHLCLV